MKAYRIKDWAKHFEKSDLKKTITWTWMPFPLKHDGKGFRRIAESSGCVRILSGWILMAQIAAKMPERGLLVDSDGPLTPDDFRLKTGFPSDVFDDALKALCDKRIGWMEEGEWDASSGWHPDTSGQHPDTSGLHDTIGEERRGEDIAASAASGSVRMKRPMARKPRPKKPRVPNVLWDEVAVQWFNGDVEKPDQSRVGKIVQTLKDFGATPEDIRARIQRYKKEWPDAECTPEALVKHWARFAPQRPPAAALPSLDLDDQLLVPAGEWKSRPPTAAEMEAMRESE